VTDSETRKSTNQERDFKKAGRGPGAHPDDNSAKSNSQKAAVAEQFRIVEAGDGVGRDLNPWLLLMIEV